MKKGQKKKQKRTVKGDIKDSEKKKGKLRENKMSKESEL